MERGKTMRLRILAGVFCLVGFAQGQGQTPANGRVMDGTYFNSYLKFSYTWPKNLRPVDPASLALSSRNSDSEYLLFVAQRENEQSGVVLIAERLESQASLLPRKALVIRDGPDFLDKIIAGWNTANPGKIEARNHFAGANGLAFDELDYRQAGEYNSAIITQIGQYLLAFRCNAKTEANLLEMRKSVLASHHDASKSGTAQ